MTIHSLHDVPSVQELCKLFGCLKRMVRFLLSLLFVLNWMVPFSLYRFLLLEWRGEWTTPFCVSSIWLKICLNFNRIQGQPPKYQVRLHKCICKQRGMCKICAVWRSTEVYNLKTHVLIRYESLMGLSTTSSKFIFFWVPLNTNAR